MKKQHQFSQLGQNIRLAYTNDGHKQADFAELVGLELRTLQNYVNGHSHPTFACVEKIANALNMTVDELHTLHERAININKPKNNRVVVNTGTVYSDDIAKDYIADLKAQLLAVKEENETLKRRVSELERQSQRA